MSQPKINIKKTKIQNRLSIVNISCIILMTAVILFYYEDLPDLIPSHFNINGEPDSMGKKFILFIHPFLALLVHLFISWINKYPHNFNYIHKITEQNAQKEYSLAINWMTILSTIIIVFLSIISLIQLLLSLGIETNLMGFTTVIFTLSIFISFISYMIQSGKK